MRDMVRRRLGMCIGSQYSTPVDSGKHFLLASLKSFDIHHQTYPFL
jgi:hypothetical protein